MFLFNDNLLVFLITTKKFRNTRIKALKDTWLQDVNYLLFSDEEDLKENIIKVSDDDTYKSNVEKSRNAYKWMYNNVNGINWFFGSDDDGFINVKVLKEFIKKGLDENCVYTAILNYKSNPTNLIWNLYGKEFEYPSGSGILFSKKTLNFIYDNVNDVDNNFGDVNFGHCLKKHNIKMLHTNLIVGGNPKKIWGGFVEEMDDVIKKSISFHSIKEEEQYWLYNKIK